MEDTTDFIEEGTHAGNGSFDSIEESTHDRNRSFDSIEESTHAKNRSFDSIEESTEEKIIGIRKKMKMCSNVTVTAVILIVVCVVAEVIISSTVTDKNIRKSILTVLSYTCNLLPIVVMLPLFFRVNLKSKLAVELKKKEGN